MGNCVYCGQSAGFLKSKHKECEIQDKIRKEKRSDANHLMASTIAASIATNADFDTLEQVVLSLAHENDISSGEVVKFYVEAFGLAVNSFLEDGLLSMEEEERLERFIDHHKIEEGEISREVMEKIVKGSIIRELTEGNTLPSKVKIDGNLPFLLQKGEVIIWVFQMVDYYERQTKTTFEGRSQGVSIRIAKGLYYRTGTFKGNPVMTEEMKYLGGGMLVLTNKHIYFTSPGKTLKIPFNKILSLEQYENGIGIQKDGATAKPQIFKGLDGWFVYNVISNLSQS